MEAHVGMNERRLNAHERHIREQRRFREPEQIDRYVGQAARDGHIHQVLQKVEGQVRFHTAMSTAFPQPAPGSAPAPGPMKIAEAEARRMVGLRQVTYVPGRQPLAVVDSTLG